ncbi:hypothetical protein ACGFNU_35110 [Spirillospora sp. NPDC048911]|uniref:hypothetical protein n=1 Tax=Spirillospora sp. NPDC048911 TaxID=3364527 RepID=UPI00371896EB
MRRPLARALMVLTPFVLVAGLAAPASADTRTFRYPKQRVSEQFRFGNACPYKIFYGQFNTAAFAEVRVYTGCGGVYTSMGLYYTGNGRRLPDNTGGGQDGCGSYLYRQVVVDNATATGMYVDFVNGNRRIFRPNTGEPTSGRAC